MSDVRAACLAVLMSVPLCGVAADEVLRDPTRPDTARAPVVATEAQPVRYVVSAIFYSAERRIAVVNGHAVAVGDRVGAARVTAIGPESLTLTVDDRVVTARLAKTTVRRRP